MGPAAPRHTPTRLERKASANSVSNPLANALHFPHLQPVFVTSAATLLTRHYTSFELTLPVQKFIMVLD